MQVPELLAKGLLLGLKVGDHSLLLPRDPADCQEDEVLNGVKHASG